MSDPEVIVFVANSNVTHKLSDSEYPKRKADCVRAVQALTATVQCVFSTEVFCSYE
jgi:galactokinase